jgi:hypothetical protein
VKLSGYDHLLLEGRVYVAWPVLYENGKPSLAIRARVVPMHYENVDQARFIVVSKLLTMIDGRCFQWLLEEVFRLSSSFQGRWSILRFVS